MRHGGETDARGQAGVSGQALTGHRPPLPVMPGGDDCFERRANVGGGITGGLRVTADRVLVRADVASVAPTQTVCGLYAAVTMAAAVEGSDAHESWYTGRVVQVGPLVGRRDHRRQIVAWIRALERDWREAPERELAMLRERIAALPADDPDPVRVGQRVAFSWQAGYRVVVDGTRYVLLRAADVLAVIEA